MRFSNSLVILFFLLLSILLSACTGAGMILPAASDNPLISGTPTDSSAESGSVYVYEAVFSKEITEEVLQSSLASARTLVQDKLERLGFSEAVVSLSGDNRLAVFFPEGIDPGSIVQSLFDPTILTFTDADGREWMTAADVDQAESINCPIDSSGIPKDVIQLTLTPEGREKFRQATLAVLTRTDGQNYLSIVSDGEVLSSPYVNEVLDSDTIVFTSDSMTKADMEELVSRISLAALSFSLVLVHSPQTP